MIKKEDIKPGMVYERNGYNDIRTVLKIDGRDVHYGNKYHPNGSSTMRNSINFMTEDFNNGDRDFTLLQHANCSTALNYSVF